MAKQNFKVMSYEVYIGRDFTFPRSPRVHFVAAIVCYEKRDKSGRKLNLGFLLPGSIRPDNFVDALTWNSFLSAAHYIPYMNLLQHATEVYAYLDDTNPSTMGLVTDPNIMP